MSLDFLLRPFLLAVACFLAFNFSTVVHKSKLTLQGIAYLIFCNDKKWAKNADPVTFFGKDNQKIEKKTIIFVRHGESTWNRNATFTGWTDVDLSERGEREVEHASRLLLEAGISVDVCYTSRLRRAIRSSWILLKGLDAVYRPVFKSWRLNERHYGSCSVLEPSRRRRHRDARRRPHRPQQA